MCGIAGIVGLGAQTEKTILLSMSARIAHRGPDDDGEWLEDGVALAHRRLAIIDLSPLGHQPMVSGCERYVIVFNGEIYNYLEIRRELEARGDCFRGHSDTEVLLAAYRRWGAECLARLNGMWAFAIWDRTERSLFASRDRFGKKPFYYFERGERLYFASEIKALRAVPGLDPAVNPAAVADFCVERISDHTEGTFFKNVRQMPAAGWMRWRDGKVRAGRFWRLEPARIGEEEPLRPGDVQSLIVDAVRLRLRADTPVGCLLSGGLDSSSVACLIAREASADQRVHAFTTLSDPPVEESSGVRRVLERHARFATHADTPTGEQFWRDLPRLLWHQEEPFADGSMAAHFALMRVAREAGVPVLLTGQGADEVFGGYESSLYAYLGSRFRSGRLLDGLMGLKAHLTLRPLPLSNIAFHSLPAFLGRWLKRQFLRTQLDWLAPEFSSPSGHIDPPMSPGIDPINDYLRQCIEVRTLPGFLHYEDRNSMAFGVETRLPFLDFRLVERIFRAPPRERYSGGRTKGLLRQSVAQIVPPPIVERVAKQGYPAPLARWLRELSPQIRALINDPSIRRNPMLVWPTWLARVERFFAGDDAELHVAWRGLVLLLWYRWIVEGDGEMPRE